MSSSISDMPVSSKPLTRRTLRVRTRGIQFVSAAVLLRTTVGSNINAVPTPAESLLQRFRICRNQYESTENGIQNP